MFMTRLISGIVLVALALAVILTGGYVLAAVLLFLAVVAYRELMKACGLAHVKEKINGLEIIGYTGIAVYYFLLVFVENKIFLLLVLITILVGFMFL